MAQMKEQNQTPEKELSEMEIANLSDAEFKTLVIRMTQRTHWVYRKHLREEIKATLSEIKKNPQGTNSEGKEAGVQINNLEHKEENFNQNSKKKKESPSKPPKNRLRSLWYNFKCTNIQIIGMPKGGGKEQEIENLFEKIMKENFPNLAKEIDIQVQEAQSPKPVVLKEDYTMTHHNENSKG